MLTFFLGALLLGQAESGVIAPPAGVVKPVLVARQLGRDVSWYAPDFVDYPNGAWGLEVVIPDEAQAISFSPAAAVVDYSWIDLARIAPADARMYLAYIEGLELYSQNAELALSKWREATDLAREVGNRTVEMHAGFLSTVALVRLGRHDETILELGSLTGRHEGTPFDLYIKHALGSALYRKGEDMDLARKILGEVIEAAVETGDQYNWVVASRQYCYTYLKHTETVAAECLEALVLSSALKKFPLIEATVLNTFAQSLDRLGESGRAREILTELLQLRVDIGSELGIAMTRLAMAHNDRKTGRSLSALANYLQSYRTLKRGGIKTHELSATIALGELYLELGDLKTASGWFEFALLVDTDLHQEQAYASLGLAQAQLASQEFDGALAALEKIIDGSANLALKTEANMMRLRVLEQANVSLPAELVETTYEQAASLANASLVGEAHYFRALSRTRVGAWDRAKMDIEAALGPENVVSTRLRASLLDTERLFVSGETVAALESLDKTIELELMRLEQAPSWHVNNVTAEVWSRVLSWIQEVGGSSLSQTLWELDVKRRSVNRFGSQQGLAFADRHRSAMDVLTIAARQAMADEVIDAHQLEQLAELDLERPAVAAEGAANAAVVVPTISYWLHGERSVAIVHDGHTPTVRRLPQDTVSTVRRMMSKQGPGLYNDQAVVDELSRVLIRPVDDVLPASGPINIAVDGYLAAIPFEVLAVGEGIMLDLYDLAYVHHPLADSIDQVEMGSAAVLANPDYRGEMESLVHSIGEAEIVESYFEKTATLRDRKASREALGSISAQRLNLLHLGVHARASVEWSAWSGLWLSGPQFVSAREIAASHYPIDLVFLSACSTSVGSMELSGTTQSLALAWLMAGSRSVISTLWDVSDAGAYEFSSGFYDSLATQNLRTAVAEAKRAMVDSGIWAEPRYWAPFQLWVG